MSRLTMNPESRLAAAFLAGGVVLIGVYFAFPAGGNAQSAIYDTLGLLSVLAMLWAVRRYRPRDAAPVDPVRARQPLVRRRRHHLRRRPEHLVAVDRRRLLPRRLPADRRRADPPLRPRRRPPPPCRGRRGRHRHLRVRADPVDLRHAPGADGERQLRLPRRRGDVSGRRRRPARGLRRLPRLARLAEAVVLAPARRGRVAPHRRRDQRAREQLHRRRRRRRDVDALVRPLRRGGAASVDARAGRAAARGAAARQHVADRAADGGDAVAGRGAARSSTRAATTSRSPRSSRRRWRSRCSSCGG